MLQTAYPGCCLLFYGFYNVKIFINVIEQGWLLKIEQLKSVYIIAFNIVPYLWVMLIIDSTENTSLHTRTICDVIGTTNELVDATWRRRWQCMIPYWR